MARPSKAGSIGCVALGVCLWAGEAGAQAGSSGPLPFDAFLREVAAARGVDWIGRPGSAITDGRSFRAIRGHILALYRGVRVERSFRVDGQIFDCVRKRRAADEPVSASPPPPAATAACAPGTIPMRRVTLEEMARLGTTRAFFGKSPGGGDADRF